MKTLVYILLIVSPLINPLSGWAQTLRNSSTTKGNQISYNIKYEKTSSGFEVLLIANTENKFSNQKMVLSARAKAMYADARWLTVNWKPVKKIIANSIPLDKLEANKNKSITVFFYFDDTGLVREVSFGVDPNSTIDGRDLEAIEKNIIGKVRGTIRDDAFKGTNYISLGDAYPMSVLLQLRNQ